MKFRNKRFLITGGAGFLGSAVGKRLCDENADIAVLDNFSTGRIEKLTFQYDLVRGNVANAGSFAKFREIDFILHFAAPSSVVLFNKNPDACITETIIGTRNVFEYAKKVGVKKVIFPSSSSVYGDACLPQSETTPTKPINLYGIAKLTCEHLSELYSDCVPSVGLRIFAGYGPGEDHKKEIASVVTLFMNDILRGSRPVIFGDGTQSRDFVYIDDIVESIIRSIQSDFVGIVNVGSGRSFTFNDVAKMINDVFGKHIEPKYIDKPSLYFEHTRADIEKTKKVLGISPISLEDGLKKYVEAKEPS